MNSAIQTVVDDQAEQIGYYYSAGVDDKLGALGDITSAMANIMASRPDRSDAFVYEKLDTIVKASNAYMSAYCAVKLSPFNIFLIYSLFCLTLFSSGII